MPSVINVETTIATMAVELETMIAARGIDRPAMIGIRTGGVWVAQRLRQLLKLEETVGELDISFYRDDFTRIGLNPSVKASSLPFETENRHLILVDDVIMSGRTIRAAMNELFDFGRPASIVLAALIDVGARELPIQPDVIGHRAHLEPDERVKLVGPDPLQVEFRNKVRT
ncbi:bifunctional pyr operon transcriptional regulator/uracil phosphoribosyltransferase [Hahella sp. CCB-MM4]|uniref:bifunctional pyr operon transcriptional regulator/uracil phosphoribosyltransferase PyrR n=1 Tax=Hahella sp. (strain CCB-MM4) TaxID=1926491 RepID=UPI000B9B9847|nr:bifunctional pyr operon transcriptional regulator/uracil phosphoribosyltransferase PyrR [Hahella sp. CCB-MM4]OZG75144.1 bifunctional pyr operon transcriptional regulator/uracil phosphoribosyltransferase [Hahella sp. CCB-MM4]